MPMTDDSIMPFGKYKDEKLINVPASYLLWLNAQWDDKPPERDRDKELKKYIEDNLDVLRMERNRE